MTAGENKRITDYGSVEGISEKNFKSYYLHCFYEMKKFSKLFRRIWLEHKSILNETRHSVGIVYTIWGFLSVWVSLEGHLPSCWSFWQRFLLALSVLILLFILCLIVSVWRLFRQNENLILTSSSNHKVVVKYGDMYAPDTIEKGYTERRNIVVDANRCFDTIVDNDLVSDQTQHGKVMKRLYDKGFYTSETLNEAIQQDLKRQKAGYEDLTVANKRKGNTFRYQCGTVAEIEGEDGIVYFLLGMSKFDSQLQASTSKEEYCLAIQRLIEFCNARAQGYPVVLPLLGSGLSRTDISQRDILSYLVDVFRINKDKISCDFYIVIWHENKDSISIKNI